MSKAKLFRKLLHSETLEFICEVHNGLSAKIVEEAGFKGLWGSSLTMSAAMGVRDNNEASWTQMLEVIDFITDATTIPLLLDADTGYGNFNNMRRLVKKLEQRGVAAVCIEDKLFPKTNSFIKGESQPLADIEEFSGKIKAAKDTQLDPDFSVIARVEAFIAGLSLEEALKRADAYHNAGADGILIHSKVNRPDQVLSFKKEWADRCPVIIVPTKYYTTPTEVFEQAGFSVVIWANMILRSAVEKMGAIARQLAEEKSLLAIEDNIAPLSEVFRLQGADELQAAEQLYLPGGGEKTKAVILAASQGADFGVLTQDKPKALLEVSGKPLIYKQVDTLNEIGVKDISVVRGFCKEMINDPRLRYIDNEDYSTTQEVFSLFKGIEGIKGKTLVSYGDILYKKYIPSMLLETGEDFVVAIDADWKSSRNQGRNYADYVSCCQPYKKNIFDQKVSMTRMGSSVQKKDVCGEWIGLIKLSSAGLVLLQKILVELSDKSEFRQMRMPDLFNELISRGHTIHVHYISGHWLDVDDIKDLNIASGF